MGEIADKTEVYWEHPRWLHVVIPAGKFNQPLLVAVCPACFTYVSQFVETQAEGKINLPQYGCKGPE